MVVEPQMTREADCPAANLSAVVNVRMTAAERQALQEQAKAAGLTVSALVRRRALGRAVVVDDRLQTLRELRSLGAVLVRMGEVQMVPADSVEQLLAAIGTAIDRTAR